MTLLATSLIVLLGAVDAPADTTATWPIILPSPDFSKMLYEKAQQLAQAEITKFNAIEKTYVNTVEFHEHGWHPVNPGGGVYIKSYRNFTHYRIDDIYRSESFLYPITIEISYKYDFFHTKPHHSEMPDSKAKAEEETEFTIRETAVIIRRYLCNNRGDYLGTLADLPPRQQYFYKPQADRGMPRKNPFQPPVPDEWVTPDIDSAPGPPGQTPPFLPMGDGWMPFHMVAPEE